MAPPRPHSLSRVDQTATRRYLMEMLPSIVAYLVLFLGIPLFFDLEDGNPWNLVLALVPLLPVLGMVIAVIRHIRRIDEYQRLRILQSCAVAFGVAMLTAIAIALTGMTGTPVVGAEWYIFSFGMASWGIASMVAVRR